LFRFIETPRHLAFSLSDKAAGAHRFPWGHGMHPSDRHRHVVALSKAPSHRVVVSGVCVHLAVVLSMQQSAVSWRSADPTRLIFRTKLFRMDQARLVRRFIYFTSPFRPSPNIYL
jgi:hypothetical protein